MQNKKYNGKEFVEMHGYDTYDIVWRQYYPAIGRFQTPDPEIEEAYNESPYAMCDNNMVNRTDPDGRFWNYLAGAVAGAAVEYTGQVVASIVASKGRISADSFTNVDLIDIAVAAGEGALTSGGSAIKSAGKRFAVTAVAELTKNTFDKNTGENVKVNDGVKVVKNTAIGLIGGEITTKAKLNVLPTQSKTKAVDASRTAAHSKGRGLSTSQAKQTAKNQEMKNTRAKNVNATLTNNLNGATGGIGSEIAKKSTDNEKKR